MAINRFERFVELETEMDEIRQSLGKELTYKELRRELCSLLIKGNQWVMDELKEEIAEGTTKAEEMMGRIEANNLIISRLQKAAQ